MNLNTKLKIFSLITIVVIPLILVWRDRKEPEPVAPVIARKEINVTIIPGWNLRQVAEDWAKKGIVTKPEYVYELLGEPAYNYPAVRRQAPVLPLASDPRWFELFKDKPAGVSYEGYLFPDTYRVYEGAKPEEILEKVFAHFADTVDDAMRQEIKKQGKDLHEILTMASIIEKEVKLDTDRAKVADIMWRRIKMGWALQVDSSVHYVADRTGDLFTTSEERQVDSPWNTYKYPGLPLGPIANPGLASIKAAIYPEKNDYWYFMTDGTGKIYYGRTLDEHNANVNRYLR
ncbi:MAG TPA: endolytic transglycosylase MltG [Patescibacteria group bacterium]|nr:endolytic transglycosylase MltG [Patescibacteria group bacterium]